MKRQPRNADQPDRPAETQVLAPLSADLELRPRGAVAGSPARQLASRVGPYLEVLDENIAGLRRLIQQAEQNRDPVAEAALRAKLVDLVTRLASLATTAAQTVTPGAGETIVCQEDLTPYTKRLAALPADVRERASKVFDELLAHGFFDDVEGLRGLRG